MAYLVLVRHGQSEWNALGLWTGQEDVSLTEQGRAEARKAAEALRHIPLHTAHTSSLSRAQQTLEEIKGALEHTELETHHHAALDERHYGEYQAKNKWEIKEQLGEEDFNKLRRTWDHPVPGGETLKDVHARVLPYFEENIIQDLREGKNVIVAAHGNSLRALMKHLDAVDESNVHELEIGTGQVIAYQINEDGEVVEKTVLNEGGKA
jgi:2,3-bisphosphoglycerate-dependent phosphoglycerate mutase